jgi:hypothetical protein
MEDKYIEFKKLFSPRDSYVSRIGDREPTDAEIFLSYFTPAESSRDVSEKEPAGL